MENKQMNNVVEIDLENAGNVIGGGVVAKPSVRPMRDRRKVIRRKKSDRLVLENAKNVDR